MNTTENELKDVFQDVRKGYRLLYEYQKRVIDLVNYLAVGLGYSNYEKGFPQFSGNYKRTKLDLWAWDWLNMYLFEFYFGKNTNNVFFALVIVSDTGFFDKNSDWQNKTQLDKYNSVENSKTKLVFVASNHEWVGTNKTIGEIYKSNVDEIIADKLDGENKKVIAKSYDLSRFSDNTSTNEILRDFIEFCNKQELTIEIDE